MKTQIVSQLLIILGIALFTSCKEEIMKHNENIIDITNVYNKKPEKINISEIALGIQYIPLETDSVSILGAIKNKDVKFFNEKILIKDNDNKLLLFDQAGRFLAKVGNIGRGPGEYKKISDFTLLPKDSLIVINSRLDKKFFFYNYSGRVIKESKIPFQTEGLFSFNNKLISINSFPFRKYSGYHTLNVFTNEGVLEKQLLYKPNEEKLLKTYGERVYWSFKSSLRNTYALGNKEFMWEVSLYNSKDTIWEISNNFKVKPKHILYFGGEKPPIKEYYRIRSKSTKKTYTSVQDYMETDKHMFIESVIAKLNKVQFIWRDKVRNININIGYNNSLKPGYNFAFYNDLDGGMPFWPDGMINGNKVFKLIYGYELKNYLQKISSREFNGVVAKKRVELQNIVENSKITDNPILMIVTLK